MRAPGLALLSLCLGACAGDTVLGGSLSEVINLDVAQVEVARNDEAVQVTYSRTRGIYVDVVIRLTVGLFVPEADGGVARRELADGTGFPLAGEYQPGRPITTVTHAPGGEVIRNLPRVAAGDIVFLTAPEPGRQAQGNFSMRFEQRGGDFGWGRTLNGTFTAVTTDAGFGFPP